MTAVRDAIAYFARGLAINQAIAIAVSLVLLRGGEDYGGAFVAATVISQCIGLLCQASMFATGRLRDRLSPRAGRAAGALLFCACGMVGAQIASRLLGWHAHLLQMATGAAVAMIVGVSQQAIGNLRLSLDDTRRELQARELQEARLVRAKTEAELAALRSRIDPHFLFNTLNSIAALIREDPERAEAATLQLSSLFRYALQAHRQPVVTLGEDLEMVRRYLDIERLRLGDRLAVEIDVGQDLAATRVPSLLLQPLVENAVKHGIAPSVTGGTIRVRAWRDGDGVRLVVANTGGTAQPSGRSGGEGLDNVRRRLAAMYGERGAVTLGWTDGWTETRVTVPAQPAADAPAPVE